MSFRQSGGAQNNTSILSFRQSGGAQNNTSHTFRIAAHAHAQHSALHHARGTQSSFRPLSHAGRDAGTTLTYGERRNGRGCSRSDAPLPNQRDTADSSSTTDIRQSRCRGSGHGVRATTFLRAACSLDQRAPEGQRGRCRDFIHTGAGTTLSGNVPNATIGSGSG